MAAEEAGWHEEAARLCGEEDLMAAVGDRSIFNLDDINLDDIFLDLNDANIPAFGAADNPPQGGLLSSGNLHGSAAAEDAPMSVDAAPAAGGAVLPEGLLCDDIDVTQLEWLSNFCEESYSSDSLGFIPCNAGDAAFHISCDDGENKKMRTNVAAAAGAAKEERNFRTSSPISVLEHTGLTVGISPPTSLSTSATTSSSTSSLSSPTSSSCSGIGGGDGDINKVPPEPVIIPARSRSKRPRPASFSPRPPIVIPLPPSSEAPAPSAASAAAPLGSVEHDNFELVAQANQLENAESACPNKSKKKKKKAPPPATTDGEEAAVTSCPAAAGAVRRCMHCEVTKTPQWRAGPMGPKTLCNACGVRYKSGRLFPEYRPAASPTFMASQHSNSHKKVVEMRINSIHDTTETAKPGARRHDVASKACELLEYIRRREWCGDTTGIIMSE